ncbi:MAG: hypothetical protein PHO42_05685 [Candidatus Omnitrophica bacterium]|nr:hypothetical protein [Candidatus Omnitrophota bacterium]
MRDLVFKALTSAESKKRDLCIQETIEKEGVLAKTERRCRYFVMGKTHIEDIKDAQELAELKFADAPYKKKHYYILKKHDNDCGEDRILCKIAGMFYVVYGSDLYCIAYVHSFKIEFSESKKS